MSLISAIENAFHTAWVDAKHVATVTKKFIVNHAADVQEVVHDLSKAVVDAVPNSKLASVVTSLDAIEEKLMAKVLAALNGGNLEITLKELLGDMHDTISGIHEALSSHGAVEAAVAEQPQGQG